MKDRSGQIALPFGDGPVAGQPLITVQTIDREEDWPDYTGEETAFIDGGVGSVEILRLQRYPDPDVGEAIISGQSVQFPVLARIMPPESLGEREEEDLIRDVLDFSLRT